MTRHTRLFAPLALALLAPALAGPPADAHPLLRIHVRPSAYRIAPPRLPQLRLPSVVRQVTGLVQSVPQAAAALVPQAALGRAAVGQGAAAALTLLHHH